MKYNEQQLGFIEAYQTTKYKVYEPCVTIEIGSSSVALNELLDKHQSTSWAFITSLNPYSKVLTTHENELRFNALLHDISNYLFYEGEGVGTDPAWLPEKSVLIIGISLDDAVLLGNKHEQNAIVAGNSGEEPELILLDAFEKAGMNRRF